MDSRLHYNIEAITSIPGAAQLIEWLGRWPSFHDSNPVDIVLSTWQPCFLCIHLTKSFSDPFIPDNEAIVTLYIEPPSQYQVEQQNHGSELLGLTLYQHPSGCEIVIEGDEINGTIITPAISRIERSIWPPQ